MYFLILAYADKTVENIAIDQTHSNGHMETKADVTTNKKRSQNNDTQTINFSTGNFKYYLSYNFV